MSFYQYSARLINGSDQPMSEYKGKVVLIVNTASKCMFTPQFEELQNLYTTYQDKGFEILGFPCDQFRHQDPGSNEQIADFCSIHYNVTFPMFGKIDVNGKDTHPLYTFLKSHSPGFLGTKNIKWNFTKFMVNRNGDVVTRYAPNVKPQKIEKDFINYL
jgi:glutathione peroxidase